MQNEISNGAMLGIVLIALAAVIGLGFGVFAIARGTANEGVANMQESLGAVSSAAFTDYDQKIVTGTQVNSAIQNFEGKPYAIMVATQATKDRSYKLTVAPYTFGDWKAAGTADIKSGSGVDTAYAGTTPVPGASGTGFPPLVATKTDFKDADGNDRMLTFINYNALLGQKTATDINKSNLVFQDSRWISDDGFIAENGKVQFNNITGNMYKTGMMEYVPSGARFQAYLVRDASGTILGIAFEQLSARR